MKIEGRHACKEALKQGKTIDKALVFNGYLDATGKEIVAELKERKIKIQFLDKAGLDRQSETRKHQGVILFVTDFVYSEVEDILQVAKDKNEAPFVVICDSIEDPHNLGSIIRTSECLGAHGVIIPKHRNVTVNETVIKTSAGATEHIKVAKVTNINQTIDFLKENGIWIVGADMHGDALGSFDLGGAMGVVVGGEDNGISALTKKNCDKLLRIEMKGNITSLNASVAGGIFIHEVSRLRK